MGIKCIKKYDYKVFSMLKKNRNPQASESFNIGYLQIAITYHKFIKITFNLDKATSKSDTKEGARILCVGDMLIHPH